MHEFHADGAAISFIQTPDNFPQRQRAGPVKPGAGKELIGALGGQAIKSGVQFGLCAGLLAQRIELRRSVAECAVSPDHVVELFLKRRCEVTRRAAAIARSDPGAF